VAWIEPIRLQRQALTVGTSPGGRRSPGSTTTAPAWWPGSSPSGDRGRPRPAAAPQAADDRAAARPPPGRCPWIEPIKRQRQAPTGGSSPAGRRSPGSTTTAPAAALDRAHQAAAAGP
jgi:hypothetical protein